MEKDFELLDQNATHDEELTGLKANIASLVEKSKKQIKAKKVVQQKIEEKSNGPDYTSDTYTPSEGFNWDNVSGAVNDVI